MAEGSRTPAAVGVKRPIRQTQLARPHYCRIVAAGEAARGKMREPQRQRLSPRGWEPHRLRLFDEHGLIFIRDQKARLGRQNAGGKTWAHGEKEAVAPFEIVLPFMVGAEIGNARLHLDDPDLPFFSERQNVGSPSAFERKLGQRPMPHRLEQPHRAAKRFWRRPSARDGWK